ncbi:sensor histidine kinase [Curtobacterium flaccumfaciens]|uniref:sensor histidine kinase n=1 Tax=Curtobacterium flaccumfaciens TaxID=2035 RepID=UPI001BDF687C|nr:histidine kinase [Curtobacterium flaccumfaciens]MBT1631784.1 two-component sensor histidine kinase [Curtobacterium flaccumfaciens pv. oortii]MCX2844750.1 histidine kinase [Curtobacterium flaccumfaciens pv. oortii]
MSLPTDPDPTDPAGVRSRSVLSWGLNAVGIAVVAFWFVRNGLLLHHPAWVWVLGAVALAAWAVREGARTPRVLVAAAGVMTAAGSCVVVPTDSLLVVPVIVGLVVLGADLRLPVWTAAVAALAAVVVVAVTATLEQASVQLVLGVSGGLLLGVLVGFSRRQVRITTAQARETERQQQRARLLADRSRASRDIHDVLAHSLGGLVLQLDAVEALLEAGRVDEATRRAGDARALAADGLAEARRAVHALRDEPQPDQPEPTRASSPSADHASGLTALLDAHRSFGGEVVVQGDAALAVLDDAHRAAVVQVVREALSNARRHAPGRPVSLSVIRDGDAVDVVVANPLPSGGQGLLGMRERFAELGSEATVEAERSDDEFVVAMHLPVDGSVDAETADAPGAAEDDRS